MVVVRYSEGSCIINDHLLPSKTNNLLKANEGDHDHGDSWPHHQSLSCLSSSTIITYISSSKKWSLIIHNKSDACAKDGSSKSKEETEGLKPIELQKYKKWCIINSNNNMDENVKDSVYYPQQRVVASLLLSQ